MTKICRYCGIEKPLTEFYKHTSGKFGVSGKCKSCYPKKTISTVKVGYKICTRCKKELPTVEFYKIDEGKRLSSWCKGCKKDYDALRYATEAERISKNKRDKYKNDSDYANAQRERSKYNYHLKKDDPIFKEKKKRQSKDYSIKNKSKRLASCRKRYAMKKNAIPIWDRDNKCFEEFLISLYRLRQAFSELHATDFHVDHIVPLHGTDNYGNHVVCGLHTQSNLRLILAKDNLIKSRYVWPDMWEYK